MGKSGRINIRISEDKKEKFYSLCEKHGLCPSILIDRWITRFISNSKKHRIDFKEIYSVASEKMVDIEEYKHPLR